MMVKLSPAQAHARAREVGYDTFRSTQPTWFVAGPLCVVLVMAAELCWGLYPVVAWTSSVLACGCALAIVRVTVRALREQSAELRRIYGAGCSCVLCVSVANGRKPRETP